MRPKLSSVSKEEGNGVVTKKGEQMWGKIEGACELNVFHIYF